MIKHEPEYFGKKGFTSPKSLKRKPNVINVGQLNEILDKLAVEKQLQKKQGKAFIDLEKLGYKKLLGAGRITQPVTVKVPFCSEIAAQKIMKVGGQILREPTAPKG